MSERRPKTWVTLARVQRHPQTGDVSLHLVPDARGAELTEGDEFLTVITTVDPFKVPG